MRTRPRRAAVAWGASAAAAIVLAAAATLHAHNPIRGEFTCPLCRKSHVDVFLGPQPFILTWGGLGIGPELRAWSYMGLGNYSLTACPHCGYCNTIRGFHLVHHGAVPARRNPYARPARPAGADAEKGEPDEGHSALRRFARLCAAEPLDYPAIREDLRKAVDPATFRYVNAYVPEQIEIILRTVPHLTPFRRLHLALLGAWACDDAGETHRGLALRALAIDAARRLVDQPPPRAGPWQRIATRYRLAAMQLSVGCGRGDRALRAAGRARMERLLADLPGTRKRAEREGEQARARITEIKRRILARARELGVPEADLPALDGEDWAAESIFEEPKAWRKDHTVAKLLDEIRRLQIDPWPEVSEKLPHLARRIRKELAADALRDRPLAEALAAARKAAPIEREGFLLVHGAGYDRPPVLGFVRELLAPLYDPTARDLLSDREQDPQFERYVTAIAQAHNLQRADFLQNDIIEAVLPETMSCDLPARPPAKGDITVKLIPASAETIRKALAALEDGEPTRGLLPGRDPAATIEDLCRADAPWMAALILDDLTRHPRAFLGIHFSELRHGQRWEEPDFFSDWRKVRPGRLIARHVPDRAGRKAASALADLASRKLSPRQAAACLIPLHFLADAGSLETLRRAARADQPVVRRTAAAALLHRRDPLAVDVLLADAIRQKRVPDMPPEAIALLDADDLPALRKLERLTSHDEQADPPEDANEPAAKRPPVDRAAAAEHPWVLAAQAHLGDADALRRYNARAFRVFTRIGQPISAGREAKQPPSLHHTPVTARCADVGCMLRLAVGCYCTEAMARELLDGVKLLPHWFMLLDRDLLRALAANSHTHAQYRKLAANLAGRPAPLTTKRELMRNAARIPTPEVTRALRRWARSAHPDLAREARATLRGLTGLARLRIARR